MWDENGIEMFSAQRLCLPLSAPSHSKIQDTRNRLFYSRLLLHENIINYACTASDSIIPHYSVCFILCGNIVIELLPKVETHLVSDALVEEG